MLSSAIRSPPTWYTARRAVMGIQRPAYAGVSAAYTRYRCQHKRACRRYYTVWSPGGQALSCLGFCIVC